MFIKVHSPNNWVMPCDKRPIGNHIWQICKFWNSNFGEVLTCSLDTTEVFGHGDTSKEGFEQPEPQFPHVDSSVQVLHISKAYWVWGKSLDNKSRTIRVHTECDVSYHSCAYHSCAYWVIARWSLQKTFFQLVWCWELAWNSLGTWQVLPMLSFNNLQFCQIWFQTAFHYSVVRRMHS